MSKGYDPPPRYYEPPEPKLTIPICPICGAETDTYVRSRHDGAIIGCPECVEDIDAWDYRMEHEE